MALTAFDEEIDTFARNSTGSSLKSWPSSLMSNCSIAFMTAGTTLSLRYLGASINSTWHGIADNDKSRSYTDTEASAVTGFSAANLSVMLRFLPSVVLGLSKLFSDSKLADDKCIEAGTVEGRFVIFRFLGALSSWIKLDLDGSGAKSIIKIEAYHSFPQLSLGNFSNSFLGQVAFRQRRKKWKRNIHIIYESEEARILHPCFLENVVKR